MVDAQPVGTAGGSSQGKRGGKNGPTAAGSFNTHKELVGNRMYETAAKLFAKRGFAGTTLQDIADEMGISRPALYHYVKSKDELLARVVIDMTEGNTAQILSLAADSTLTPIEKLYRIAHVMACNRALQPSRFLLLKRSEADLSPELAEIHQRNERAVLRALIGLIDEGVTAGGFRPVNARSAALAVIGMCNWVAWWFHDDDAAVAGEVADDLADIAVAALIRSPDRVTKEVGPRSAAALLRQDLTYLERLLDESERSQ